MTHWAPTPTTPLRFRLGNVSSVNRAVITSFIKISWKPKCPLKEWKHSLIPYCSPRHFFSHQKYNVVESLTLLAYLKTGGTYLPPVYILGWVLARVPILFGNDLSGSYLSYSKGFMKFGLPTPPSPEKKD